MHFDVSQINQRQKDKYYMFHFYEVPRAVTFIETDARMLVARDWGREMGTHCVMSLALVSNPSTSSPAISI